MGNLKLSLLFVARLSAIPCALLLVWLGSLRAPQQAQQAPQTAFTSATKRILMWNKFYDAPHFGFNISRQLFEDNDCEVTDCQIWDAYDGMADGIPVEDFDLLWFHGYPINTLWPERPQARKPHQVYMFYLYEPPEFYDSDFRNLNGFFNWTATYRSDSDIFMSYGWFVNKTLESVKHSKPHRAPTFIQPRFDNITTQVTGKTRPVYWRVSNCVTFSNRDVYVEELSRHIQVDIFGKCGTPCTGDTCDRLTQVKTYKFYLAFENSLCKDYMSEKLYNTMRYDLVPVVRGGGDYARHAPPHSYVNVDDFETPRDLAEYLHYLDGDDAEYRKYFWWKDYYMVVYMGYADNLFLCGMCAMLHDPPPPKAIDLKQWWQTDASCVMKPAGLMRYLKRQFLFHRVLFVSQCVVLLVVVVLLKNRWVPLARRLMNYRRVGSV